MTQDIDSSGPFSSQGCHTNNVRLTLCAFVALAGLACAADPLPVVPMKMDPEQVARLFLRRPAPSYEECLPAALEICPDGISSPDVSLRWVQLDDDPEPEAILTATSSGRYAGYVFDRHGDTWNQVGSFMFFRENEGNDLFRVKKLTEDSPTVLFFTRDLGGSASSIFTTSVYQLREGRLWRVFEATPLVWSGLPPPERWERSTVLASKDRLIVHKVDEVGKQVTNTCEVQRWDAKTHQFVPAPADRTAYCDLKTGKPIPGKAHASGIPVIP